MADKLSELERRIADKLRIIEPVQLQRLAEDMAKARDPERYSNLQILGRNSEGQTTDGWPDAYVDRADGIDAIEATKERNLWQRHLRSDLIKAGEPGRRLSGYFYVGGFPKTRPAPEKIDYWRRKFCELGIPEDRVTILLGMSLVRELCQPRHARVRQVHLGIAAAPELFEIVRPDRAPVGAGPFTPDAMEYASGDVHRPALQEQVRAALRESRCALVRGRGASGKTVLAHSVAVGPEREGVPAYRLDLAHWAGRTVELRGRIERQMLEFGDEGVLFIIDNIHLDEELAASVYESWRETAGSGACLLLVGREVHQLTGSALEATDLAPFLLRAQSAEMVGVYRRIAARSGKMAEIPLPSASDLRAWGKTFGGDPDAPDFSVDLMAFSAAVQHRLPAIGKGDLTLRVIDARIEVRDRYLRSIQAEELENLFRLASLPQDVPLLESGLKYPYAGLASFTRSGLVFQRRIGGEGDSSYSLVHAALGKLVLAAAYPGVDRLAECLAAASAGRIDLVFLAQRAAADEDVELARDFMTRLGADQDWLLSLRDYNSLSYYFDFSMKLGSPLIPSGPVADTGFANNLASASLKMELHFLTSLLKFLQNFDKSPIGAFFFLATFLHKERAQVSARALAEQFDHLLTFLIYIRGATPPLKSLYRFILKELAEHTDVILARIIEENLEKVGAFLNFANTERTLRDLYFKSLSQMIRNRERLAIRLTECSIEQVTSFLRFSRTAGLGMTVVYRTGIDKLLIDPKQVADRITKAPIEQLIEFLSELSDEEFGSPPSMELGKRACREIDLEEWTEFRRAEKSREPTIAGKMGRVFIQLQRPELAEATSRKLIEAADPVRWKNAGVTIKQLADVFRYCGELPEQAAVRFFDRAIGADWLDRNYQIARAGGLAGALMSLASLLPLGLHARLVTDELKHRISTELARGASASDEVRAEIVSLVGSCSLLGLPAPDADSAWLEGEALARLCVARRPPQSAITYRQIQFWLGVRQLASNSARLVIPGDDAELAVESWAVAKPPNAFAAAVNSSMLNWFERCRKAGWAADPAGPPVRADIERSLAEP